MFNNTTTLDTPAPLPADLLSQFALIEAMWSDCVSIRRQAARNSDTPLWVLAEFVKDANLSVRHSVSQNVSADAALLHTLASSPLWATRLSVCEHPNTSADTLAVLAEDHVREVSLAAQEALKG